jgi:hypothetical protein
MSSSCLRTLHLDQSKVNTLLSLNLAVTKLAPDLFDELNDMHNEIHKPITWNIPDFELLKNDQKEKIIHSQKYNNQTLK